LSYKRQVKRFIANEYADEERKGKGERGRGKWEGGTPYLKIGVSSIDAAKLT
jgi:hypothetical protein